MNEPAVLLENLQVAAGRKTLLAVDHLRVERSEVFAVIGPNGSGKSTLLKTCLGFLRPSAGRVAVLGEAVNTLGYVALGRLRRRIGYVAQELTGHSEMPLTVREVAAIGRTGRAGLLRPLRREDWRQVDTWLERLGLAALAGRPYRDLSGGEQRKTLLARAMAQQPQLLLLDEPTAYLDLYWREQIVAALPRLYAQTAVTVVLVCHEMEVIPSCCQRMAVLENGRVTALGPPEAVLNERRVSALYGPNLQVLHPGGRHAVLPAGGG